MADFDFGNEQTEFGGYSEENDEELGAPILDYEEDLVSVSPQAKIISIATKKTVAPANGKLAAVAAVIAKQEAEKAIAQHQSAAASGSPDTPAFYAQAVEKVAVYNAVMGTNPASPIVNNPAPTTPNVPAIVTTATTPAVSANPITNFIEQIKPFLPYILAALALWYFMRNRRD